jgi:hypothetical protein
MTQYFCWICQERVWKHPVHCGLHGSLMMPRPNRHMQGIQKCVYSIFCECCGYSTDKPGRLLRLWTRLLLKLERSLHSWTQQLFSENIRMWSVWQLWLVNPLCVSILFNFLLFEIRLASLKMLQPSILDSLLQFMRSLKFQFFIW